MLNTRKIAVLSLCPKEGEHEEMWKSIRNHALEEGFFVGSDSYIELSRKHLNGEITFSSRDYGGVILIHSVKESRLAITDVEDATYNTLLPFLRKEFGSEHVGVIIFSVPGCNDNTNWVKLATFKAEQPSTIMCSKNIILCGSSEISRNECESLFASFNENVSTRARGKGNSYLIIGIKPHIPLLIMQLIEPLFKRYDAELTFKTLDACEHISEGPFCGAFIVCDSPRDVKIFTGAIKHAKNERMYKKAMDEAAKLKTVFLPRSSKFAVECKMMFQNPTTGQSNECMTFEYIVNGTEEGKSVSFLNSTELDMWIKEHLEKSRKPYAEITGGHGMITLSKGILVFLTIIFISYWFFNKK